MGAGFKCMGCHGLTIELATATRTIEELRGQLLARSGNFKWEVGVKAFDIKSKCAKCGSAGPATVEHVPALPDVTSPADVELESLDLGRAPREIKKRLSADEHIRRECLTCGFAWAEATLDVAKQVA